MKKYKHQISEEKKRFRKIYRIPIIISILSFVVLIFLIPLPFIVFNKSYYYNHYEQNRVYDVLGRNNTQALTFSLLTFFRCDEKAMNQLQKKQKNETCEVFLKGNYTHNSTIFYFTKEEIAHLHDVKHLVRLSIGAIYIALLVFLLAVVFMYISIKRKKEKIKNFFNLFTKIVFQGSIFLLLIYIIVVIFVFLINFSSFFNLFHSFFFPKGNYSFPNNSLLITLFPESFFYNAAKKIWLSGVITSIIVILASFVLNILIKKSKE
ncbi:MAG: DUF1461 domain-containing protein [Candidatus Woesearchaeota archaeon]